MSASTSSAPLVVGAVCVRPGCGHGEDLHDGICFGTACECVRFVAVAGALPMPVGPEPQDVERLRELLREATAGAAVADDLTAEWRRRAETAEARVAELERPAVVRHRVGVRDSYRELAAQARQDGDYEGEAVVLQQLAEREVVWAREDELAREFAADPLATKPYVPGPSVGASADRLARLLAPRESEGEHYSTVHHSYRLGHDLPETGGTR